MSLPSLVLAPGAGGTGFREEGEAGVNGEADDDGEA
jgi:hypothetical protein